MNFGESLKGVCYRINNKRNVELNYRLNVSIHNASDTNCPKIGDVAFLEGAVKPYEEEITEYARRLQQMGARNVLVSMAGEGALLLDGHGAVRRIHCPKGEVVNSVGAGDSMVAGFLAGYLQTGDYSYALKLGSAAGSATAFSLGLADWESIAELLKQM